MDENQTKDMWNNASEFETKYEKKYIAGQQEHGGNLWTMGLKQVSKCNKEEILDQWSYACTIDKIIAEIEAMCKAVEHQHSAPFFAQQILDVINRVKED